MRRPSFSYRALDTQRREIRLFDIQPNSNLFAPVACSVRHVSLLDDPKPQYEAISYAWDNIDDRSHILADGAILELPASAERSLRRVRLPDRPRTVWIDSGSIHQADVDERSAQVAIMTDIYRHSQRSIVFLGESDENTEGWLGEARELLSEMYSSGFHEKVLQGRGPNREHRYPFRNFPALSHFYWRSWFQRLWVIQEVALAPDSICLLGDHALDTIEILRLAAWINHTMKVDWTHHGGVAAAAAMQSICDQQYGRNRPALTDWCNMKWLITTARSSKCTDGRDRVFAVQGLVGATSTSDIPTLLVPDYKKPVHVVYRDAIRHFHSTGTRLLLYEVRHRTQADIEGRWPSWVVDWSRGFDPMVDSLSLSAFEHVAGGYNAATMERSADPNMVALHGCVVDHVWRCGKSRRDGHWGNLKATKALLRRTTRLAHISTKDMYTPSEAWKAMSCTVVAESMVAGVRAPKDAIFSAAVHYWRHLRRFGRCPELSAYQDDDSDDALVSASLYANGLQDAWTNRRFFVTKSGRFGLGPTLIKAKDVVAELGGMQTPVILRPCNNGEFRFVGEAYVHGLMDGEATQGLRDDDLTVLNIR